MASLGAVRKWQSARQVRTAMRKHNLHLPKGWRVRVLTDAEWRKRYGPPKLRSTRIRGKVNWGDQELVLTPDVTMGIIGHELGHINLDHDGLQQNPKGFMRNEVAAWVESDKALHSSRDYLNKRPYNLIGVMAVVYYGMSPRDAIGMIEAERVSLGMRPRTKAELADSLKYIMEYKKRGDAYFKKRGIGKDQRTTFKLKEDK